MVVVIPGALEDKKNLSEEEYYQKWNQTKAGNVYGFPMEVRSEKEVKKDVSKGFWGTAWADISSSAVFSLGRILVASEGEKDPNFKITEENVRGYEEYLNLLLYANNEKELSNYKAIVDDIRLKKRIVSEANGFWGISGKLASMFADPTVFAGGVVGSAGVAGIKTLGLATKGFAWANKAKNFAGKYIADVFGKDFAYTAGGSMLRTVGNYAATGAATGTAVVGIESLVGDIDKEDILKTITMFSIMSGGVGLFVGANKSKAMSLQRKKAIKLSNAVAKNNPNKIVLTDAEWKKAIDNPEFANTKIKSALGLEYLQTAPDVRGNLSPSNTTRSIMNALVDNPFSLINETTGEIVTVSPSIESTASSLVAENLYKLQTNINDGYTKYIKEKYGETNLAKLKTFKDLHVWAGGKDYEEFLEELSKESFNPGSTSSSAIRELATKNYNEIIKPLADYGMEHDLWGYKANDLFEIDKQIKAIGKVELSKEDLLAGKATEAIEKKKAQIEELKTKRSEIEKKKYTQKDFRDLPFGEHYFPRRFDAYKVARDRVGAIDAIREGFWSVSKFRDLRNTSKKLDKKQKKALEKETKKINEAAEGAVSKILHEEDKGYVSNPRKTRGSEHQRNLNFSTEYVKEFLIQDPMNALRDYVRTVITDTELIKRFGTLDRNVLAKNIELSYEDLIKASVSENQRKALIRKREQDLEDLACVWCRVRGVKEYSAEDLTEWGRAFNHAANIANNLNVARLIGGTVISATTDLAQACMTVGFKNFFGGLKKWFNKDFREAFRGEEDIWIRAIDHFKNTRQLGFYNQMIDSGVLAATDNFTGKLADLGVKMSLITKWDELNKFVVGYVAQERILKIGEKLSKKIKLPVKDLEWLTTTGISEENAVKMFDQFSKYGRVTEGGIWESSVGFWDDVKLKNMFRGSVKKLQNQAILTPTAGSVPRFFDEKGLKTVLQFKRFTFSAYSKCMIPTLQKRDLEAFTGLTMMMSIGVMKAYLRALKGGYAISMADAVKTSLKEAEVGSYFGDAYGLLSNFAGLNEKKNQTSQQFMRDMLGTGYGLVETAFSGVPGLAKIITGLGGEMNYGQIHNARKLVPLQNNILLSKLFDRFEESIIERRGTKRAKRILENKKEKR